MSDPKSFWQFLLSNPVWVLIVFMLVQQPWRPWVRNTLRVSRNTVVRAGVAAFRLLALITRRFLARPPISHDTLIIPPAGSLTTAMVAPEPMPPGPQGPPMQPQFVNNSQWMQWQAARAAHYHSETGMLMAMQAHEHELERSRFAMRSTMPRYNHALTP
jgi:hypothetical protein